jgi:hypothetical protein
MTTTPLHLTSNPEVGTIVCADCFYRRPIETVDPDTQICTKCSKKGRRR